MLNVYGVSLSVCRRVAPIAARLTRVDVDLARQLKRAVSSVPLNLAEGPYSQGGNRRARYSTALGSAGEVRACLEVALAMGYVGQVDEQLHDELDQVIRTLARLAAHRA